MIDAPHNNKAIIVGILTSAFTDHDYGALDRHLAPDYIQHNTFIPPKRAGLKAFIGGLADNTLYEPGMIVAEGDLVMVHGRYSGLTATPKIAVDIFRFEDGFVAEHWDVLQDEIPVQETVSGNPMFTNASAL